MSEAKYIVFPFYPGFVESGFLQQGCESLAYDRLNTEVSNWASARPPFS